MESNSILAILIPVAGLVGGAIVWTRKAIRDGRKEDEETAIKRYENLLERIDKDRKECLEENECLRSETTQAKLLAERAVTWIKLHEKTLDTHNIPYLKFEGIQPEPKQ